MTSCWFCGTKMVHIADFGFKEYGLSGEGVVANLFCSTCKTTAEFYKSNEDCM